MNLERIELYCITNDKMIDADVLSCNDKHLKVAFTKTNVTCMLRRLDTRRPYVGRVGHLEFKTTTEPERV